MNGGQSLIALSLFFYEEETYDFSSDWKRGAV